MEKVDEEEEEEEEQQQQEQEEEVKEVDEEEKEKEKEKEKEDDSLLVAIPRRLTYSQLRTQFMQLHKKPEKKWAPNISGFIAQLVRASQRYREVTGSNSVEVLIFVFSGFLRNCINCVHNCEESYSFAFITAVLIRFISYTSITFTGTYEHIIDQLPTSVAS